MSGSVDISDQFPGCMKAEQKDSNVLILRRLKSLHQRADQRWVRYEVEYRWLSNPSHPKTAVLGQEFTFFGHRDVTGWTKKSLFDIFQIF